MKTKRRVMIKITGEGLSSKEKNAFDDKKCIEVAKQIKQALSKGIQIAVVIGGGNFWRGRQNDYIDRYIKYKEENPELDIEKVIINVNIGLDNHHGNMIFFHLRCQVIHIFFLIHYLLF